MKIVEITFLAVLAIFCIAVGNAANPVHPTCSNIGEPPGCGGNTLGSSLWDDSVNIRFFGAKGDNVTDDTAAIQAAIDYAYNNNLQNIFCPNGNYVTSSTIYLDPPGNLRSNFANPTIFNFSLALIGQNQGGANHEGFGCNIRPNFNNSIALMIGPGQGMHVSSIQILAPNNAYRGNLNTSGVGIGISGGNGGASRTLIERTWVENFYICYQTSANTNGSLSDSNTFFKTAASNCFVGIDFAGTQNDINHVTDVLIQGSTINVRSSNGRPVLVSSGNLSTTNGQFANFTIGSVSAITNSGGIFSFTGVITSPDIYWPNVYNSFTMVTAHFGVVPLTLTSWNSGTSTGTFKIEPLWVWHALGHADITTTTDIQAELQAATTIYAVERITTLQGQSISSDNTHVENPSICTTFLDLLSNFTGVTTPHINTPFFNFDPAMTNKTGPNIALLYCAQTFPFVRTQTTGNNTKLVWTGGDFSQSGCGFAPILFEFQPFYEASFEKLNFINQINIRVSDQSGAAYAEPGGGTGINNYENAVNGAGFWDANYFIPQKICTGGSFSTLLNILNKGVPVTPFVGFHPAPWASPNLSPYIKALIDAAGGLGTYPPISCQTVYKSVEWNSGTLAHAHLRSASCPGYSWGQNIDDSTVGTSHGTFTGGISNGAGGSGTQLVVTGLTGSLALHDEITGAGVAVGEYITACPGGGCSTNGTYTVSTAANISAEAMTSFPTTVTWSYKGQSGMLYVDATSMAWLFPGIGFTLSGGNNPSTDAYAMTGIFPQLGYITAMDTTSAQFGGNPLQGTKTTIYSCSNQCAIKQAPFSWTAY